MRMGEIVTEIAYFFDGFAKFMGGLVIEVETQIALIDSTVKQESIRDSRRKLLIDSTDGFFIKQTAEWHAVYTVSDTFVACFNDGWSNLNRVRGNYLAREELAAFLSSAGKRIEEIVQEREKDLTEKIVLIQQVLAQSTEKQA